MSAAGAAVATGSVSGVFGVGASPPHAAVARALVRTRARTTEVLVRNMGAKPSRVCFS
jgi:hypothetical protein